MILRARAVAQTTSPILSNKGNKSPEPVQLGPIPDRLRSEHGIRITAAAALEMTRWDEDTVPAALTREAVVGSALRARDADFPDRFVLYYIPSAVLRDIAAQYDLGQTDVVRRMLFRVISDKKDTLAPLWEEFFSRRFGTELGLWHDRMYSQPPIHSPVPWQRFNEEYIAVPGSPRLVPARELYLLAGEGICFRLEGGGKTAPRVIFSALSDAEQVCQPPAPDQPQPKKIVFEPEEEAEDKSTLESAFDLTECGPFSLTLLRKMFEAEETLAETSGLLTTIPSPENYQQVYFDLGTIGPRRLRITAGRNCPLAPNTSYWLVAEQNDADSLWVMVYHKESGLPDRSLGRAKISLETEATEATPSLYLPAKDNFPIESFYPAIIRLR